MVSPEQYELSLTIGERFRQARELSSLSRKAFCNKHELNWFTVQSWELGRNFSRGTNVTKFCEALAREGVTCTEDWLIEGIGPAPYLESSQKDKVYVPAITSRQLKKVSSNPYDKFIQMEIALFCENSEKMGGKAVVIQLSDEAMAPDYETGEVIGALHVPFSEVDCFHQTVCLVEATPHHFLVRRLLREGDSFILLATNNDYPLIRLEKITSVAEIVWRRRHPTLGKREDISPQQK